MENVAKKLIQPAGDKSSNNNILTAENSSEPASGYQYVLDIDVEVEKVVDGIEMSVVRIT